MFERFVIRGDIIFSDKMFQSSFKLMVSHAASSTQFAKWIINIEGSALKDSAYIKDKMHIFYIVLCKIDYHDNRCYFLIFLTI